MIRYTLSRSSRRHPFGQEKMYITSAITNSLELFFALGTQTSSNKNGAFTILECPWNFRVDGTH